MSDSPKKMTRRIKAVAYRAGLDVNEWNVLYESSEHIVLIAKDGTKIKKLTKKEQKK